MKEYTKPEIVITSFTTEDIMVPSNVNNGGMGNKDSYSTNDAPDYDDLDWL